MGKKESSFEWALVLLLLLLGMAGTHGVTDADCQEEKTLGLNACKPVIYGSDPTPDCCERVRVSDLYCVCPMITPSVAAIITAFGVDRAIQLIEGCGRPVASKFQCGSITTP